jgi:hypothetical protein
VASIDACAATDAKTHKQLGCLQIFDKADIELSNRSYDETGSEPAGGNESS